MKFVQVVTAAVLVEVSAGSVVDTPSENAGLVVAQETQCRAIIVPGAFAQVILVEVGAQNSRLRRTVRALGQRGRVGDRAEAGGSRVAIVAIGALQRRRRGQAAAQLRRQVGRLAAPRLGDRVIAGIGIAGVEIQPFVRGQVARAVVTVAVTLEADFLLQRLARIGSCLLYTSPSPRDGLLSRMPSSA